MTPHHELLARAIEALRIINICGHASGASLSIVAEYDNPPPAVAAEPVAWQYLSDHGWIECGTRDAALVATKAGFKTRSLYTEQPSALSAELTAALVFSVHLMRATRANNEAAIVRAFLDSAPAVTPPNTKPVV